MHFRFAPKATVRPSSCENDLVDQLRSVGVWQKRIHPGFAIVRDESPDGHGLCRRARYAAGGGFGGLGGGGKPTI
jgi:hypothetical protein